LIALIAFSACTSTRRYTTLVSKAYHTTDTSSIPANPGIKIAYTGSRTQEPIVKVQKGPGYFIPALLYWGIKQSFYCELNPDNPMRIIKSTFLHYADSIDLSSKLAGRTLEIDIDTLPRKFTYLFRDDIVILVIWFVQIANQSISPASYNMVLTYRLYDNGKIIKQQTIELWNDGSAIVNNLASQKKITRQYIHRYNNDIRQLAMQGLMRIANEL
jgi:hypothetical protein